MSPPRFLSAGQIALIDMLRQLPQAKIVVTHDTRFARAIASRAVFFERGTIIANGPVLTKIATNSDGAAGLARTEVEVLLAAGAEFNGRAPKPPGEFVLLPL